MPARLTRFALCRNGKNPNSGVMVLAFSDAATARAVRADQLDFNALQLGEEVQGYYNGGLGSMGTGRGPNLAISFTSDFATIADGVFGPPLRAEKLTTGSGTMDIAAGFSGFFSFYYKNSGPSGTVNLYSGLDGGGALVGTIPLPAASIFSPAGLFEGTPFKSAVFTGNADALVFDNITLGGGLVIPEPGSALSDGQRDGWDGTDPEDIHESICQAFNFWCFPSGGGAIRRRLH